MEKSLWTYDSRISACWHTKKNKKKTVKSFSLLCWHFWPNFWFILGFSYSFNMSQHVTCFFFCFVFCASQFILPFTLTLWQYLMQYDLVWNKSMKAWDPYITNNSTKNQQMAVELWFCQKFLHKMQDLEKQWR